MRTLTSGTLVVQAYDEQVWKQERNVLVVTDPNATKCRLYWPTSGVVVAEYTLSADHKVEIDVSDFVRLHSTGAQNLYVRTDGGSPLVLKLVNANYNVAGLINPTSLVIPSREVDALIEPPSMMLAQVGGARLAVELYATADSRLTEYGGTIPYITQLAANTVHTVLLRTTTNSIGYITGVRVKKSVRIKEHDCGREYVAVRWVSCTGATRVHTWMVTKRKTETADVVNLLTQDGSYNVLKGRRDGFSIRIDGLMAYDYWYYSDVCHSSKVEVSFDGETWQRVNVLTKGVTMPDGNGGKLGNIEVELNYKEYDAVAM